MTNTKLKIFAIIAVFALAGGGIYWFFLYRDIETFKPLELFGGRADKSASDERSNQRDISGWQKYENSQYGFSFSYPGSSNVSDFADSGGKMILFKNAASDNGFQIFITAFDEPFDSTQGKSGPITKERILKDIPDMAISGDEYINIGGFDKLTASGEKALSFISQDDLGGKTREIWAVHDGYLYQIKAYENFEKQMMEILSSWRFSN